MSSAQIESAPVAIPRVAITYCTQCRWMLRAAYFAQELLSTFSTQIGEVALIPATGGLFSVELTYIPTIPSDEVEGEGHGQKSEVKKVLIWDRKTEGGFPETKVLKQRVRDHIDPGKDLGHSDRHGKKKEEKEGESGKQGQSQEQQQEEKKVVVNEGGVKRNPDGSICEDCR